MPYIGQDFPELFIAFADCLKLKVSAPYKLVHVKDVWVQPAKFKQAVIPLLRHAAKAKMNLAIKQVKGGRFVVLDG